MADGTAQCYSALVDLTQAQLGYEWKITVNRSGEDSFDVEVSDFVDHATAHVMHANYANISHLSDPYAPWNEFQRFSSVLDVTMTAEATSLGWSDPDFTVTFTPTTGKYVLSAADTFSITAANTDTANFLGFSGSQGLASTHTSSGVAAYCMVPSIDARTNFSREYEPGNISSLAVSDSGRVKKGIVRESVPLYMDWQQAFDPISVIFTAEATGTVFHTWQDFWGHCRQTYPFIVHTASNNFELHMLRKTASNFTPVPVEGDNHEYWHLNFETHFMGRDPDNEPV